MSRLHVLLFTHDLRVHDHAALAAACQAARHDHGQVLPLYIFDPTSWQTEQASARQFDFLIECLRDLNQALEARGSALQVEIGDPETVLRDLHRRKGIASLHLHETPFTADAPNRGIETLCRRAGIPLRVHGQNGISAVLKDVQTWRHSWRRTMSTPRVSAPDQIPSPALTPANWPQAKDASLAPTWLMPVQIGGRKVAIRLLKPELGEDHDQSGPPLIDQLSAHLVYGTLSAREVWQRLQATSIHYRAQGNEATAVRYEQQIEALEDWCEAAQRLLSAPQSRSVAAAGQACEHQARLRAWKNGRCGVPVIDASLRAILAHGVINPVHQPLLMDFATEVLGLSKTSARAQLTSLCTAPDPRLYLDLPNRIDRRSSSRARLQHFVRQSKALDPDGLHIRRYIPELADLPTEHLHAPWEAPVHALIDADIVIGQTYPNPGAEEAKTAVPAMLSAPTPSVLPAAPMRLFQRQHPDPKTGQFSFPF